VREREREREREKESEQERETETEREKTSFLYSVFPLTPSVSHPHFPSAKQFLTILRGSLGAGRRKGKCLN
jgi:hypothetical protein